MREILFRGQTRRYGEKVRMGDGAKVPSNWVYGGILKGKGAHSIIYGGKNIDNPGEGFDKWPVYSDTVGQFTGLTDKNGKKIFEGDIVRCIATMRDGKELVGYILYDDCCFCVKENRTANRPAMDLCDAFEVIGNIHDNPELLKVGAEDGQANQ